MSKKILLTIAAVIIMCFIWLTSTDAVENLKGTKTGYLESSSSCAQIITTDNSALFFNKTGVSVELKENVDPERLLEIFNATLVFAETTADGTSYYAYSTKLKRATELNGKRINLHVHKSKDRTVVGSPIIFGSF